MIRALLLVGLAAVAACSKPATDPFCRDLRARYTACVSTDGGTPPGRALDSLEQFCTVASGRRGAAGPPDPYAEALRACWSKTACADLLACLDASGCQFLVTGPDDTSPAFTCLPAR